MPEIVNVVASGILRRELDGASVYKSSFSAMNNSANYSICRIPSNWMAPSNRSFSQCSSIKATVCNPSFNECCVRSTGLDFRPLPSTEGP